MFRKKTPEPAPTLWIARSDLPTTPATGFYHQVERILAAHHFGDEVRRRTGRPNVVVASSPPLSVGAAAAHEFLAASELSFR